MKKKIDLLRWKLSKILYDTKLAVSSLNKLNVYYRKTRLRAFAGHIGDDICRRGRWRFRVECAIWRRFAENDKRPNSVPGQWRIDGAARFVLVQFPDGNAYYYSAHEIKPNNEYGLLINYIKLYGNTIKIDARFIEHR